MTAGHDLYRDVAFGGGMPNAEFAAAFAGLRATWSPRRPTTRRRIRSRSCATPRAAAQGFAALDAAMYAEIDTGGPRAFDVDFWQSRAPRHYLKRVVRNGIPAFMVSGWFDVYQRGAPLNVAALQNLWARQRARRLARRRGRSAAAARPAFGPMPPAPETTPRYQLVMGPWFHDPTGLGQRYQELMLEWFDTWLKGEAHGNARAALVRCTPTSCAAGAGSTRSATRCGRRASTHAMARRRPAWRRAARREGSDRLRSGRTPPARATAVPTSGTRASSPYVLAMAGAPPFACAADDRTTQAGARTYTSEPFERDQTIAGPISASLFASATSSETEWVVHVEDVGPDGSSYPLTSGALLGSHRALDEEGSWRSGDRLLIPRHAHTSEAAREVPAGEVQRYDVEVYPVFARIAAGHRLRVTLATSTTHLHPPVSSYPKLAGGIYEVRRGGEHASHVNVPFAEPGALRSSPVSWGNCQGEC